jgi:NAD(P)-dependent dehydrogenase (short-subunit alcohol dehydrogenase family)
LKRNSDYSFKPDATYLISGGLGGIGRAIVKWLVQRGARNLLLLSRSGLDGHPKAKEMVSNLSKTGVRIEAPICDISDRESLQSVLKKYTGIIPAVKSCFQAAMVLKVSHEQQISIIHICIKF